MPISSQQKKAATRKLVVTPPPIRGKAPVGGDNVSKAAVLTRMLENDAIRAIRAPSGDVAGFVDRDGGIIKQASILWAEFLALTPAQVANESVVYVRDKQCTFIWNSLGCRWFNIGGRLSFASLANAITDISSAKWSNQEFFCDDVVGGQLKLKHNGARFVPASGGRASLFSKNYGSLASPTNSSTLNATSHIFDIGSPSYPIGLFATNDKLFLRGRWQKRNAGGTCQAKITLGTSGVITTDAAIWEATIPNNANNHTGFDCYADISAATVFTTNTTAFQAGTGGASQLTDKTNTFNTAAAMVLTAGVNALNASDRLDLLSLSLDWQAGV
ncbi:hypothetical protein R2083_07980 [Nitrosomonas sp. Is35]|uniref:hypothetical protein n=1 Tax=Nitrosomonas sp. Is35 TaxID=3080534 RepID=UPI00294AE9CB|nr:hypothetical protein [Nitrosomonas sp. Is35]MDV6347451.1 hypothetical protein [Nitrosomonas sp. Is35]